MIDFADEFSGIDDSLREEERTPAPGKKQSLADSTPLLGPLDRPPGVPEFLPAVGLGGGNRQTLFATLFGGNIEFPRTVARHVRLPDDDVVVLHDDCPVRWKRGDHCVLLLHGLAGSAQSGYMQRIAAKLNAAGVRTFRMDHRGCGNGINLAQQPYHAGRTQDLHEALLFVERICTGSPVSVAGFSLSGNLLLRYLGEQSGCTPLSLFRAVAVCPPVDLAWCVDRLPETRLGQRYDWYFARKLVSQIANTRQWHPNAPLAHTSRPPRCLRNFDELYTAPVSGFDSADHYYETASARDVIPKIRIHTTILAALDDPLVCAEPLKSVRRPTNVTLAMTRYGGHLGFVGRRGSDPDRRWMDWRVIEWLLD